jgi:hypothetical protein
MILRLLKGKGVVSGLFEKKRDGIPLHPAPPQALGLNKIRSRSTHMEYSSILPVTPVAQVRTWCIHEQNVCSFSNITSHRNHLLLFVEHLAMRFLARKCRVRHQYIDL